MNLKRAIMTAVIVLAVAALALPIIGSRVRANGTSPATRALSGSVKSLPNSVAAYSPNVVVSQNPAENSAQAEQYTGKISPEFLKGIGVKRLPKGSVGLASQRLAKKIT